MPGSPHQPTKLATYLNVHENRMANFLSGEGRFVVREELVQKPLAGEFRIYGEIACLGNIVIQVDKTLEVLSGDGPDAMVRTVDYAYNASVRGHGSFLRYDNAHVHPSHPDRHHRHVFNWRTGEEVAGSPFHTGITGWPTLSQFIEEVETWYWDNRDELPEPGAVPTLGLFQR